MTAQKRRAGGAYRQKSRMITLYAKPGKDRSKASKSKRATKALGTVEQLARLAQEGKSHETPG